MAKAILAHDISPVWVPSPEVEGIRDLAGAYDGATARLGDREAAAARVPRQPGLRLRRHHARRKPEEVLDLRLPEVARQGQAGGRWRGSGACGAEERGRGRGGGPRDLLSEYRAAVRCRPDRRGGGRPPVDQGLRVRAGRRLRVRGRRLLEVPFRQAGDVLFRPRAEAEVERGLRAPRRDQRGRQRARQELAVEGSWSYVQASHQPKLMPKGSGVPLEVRMHGRKGSERLLRRREEMLARGMPQAKANAATAAELVRWLWALGAMCREAPNRHSPRPGEPGGLRGYPRFRWARGSGRMRVVRLGEPRRRNGVRADRTVSADMRLSRRRRRHAGGGPGRVQRQAPPTDCKRSAGPLWLLTADWVI